MTVQSKRLDQLVFWASCGAYGLLALYLVAAYMPGSIIRNRYVNTHIAASLYPAKWDFYTGSALEPVYHIYNIDNGKLVREDIQPFVPRFFFGLKRDGKIIFSEEEMIATDTAFVDSATRYVVNLPRGADINSYLHADTLRYNNYQSDNVRYLHGKWVLCIEDFPTWQQMRKAPHGMHTLTLVPINITGQ